MLFYKKTFCISIYFFSQHIIKMEYLKLKDLNLSLEESRYIIEFLA